AGPIQDSRRTAIRGQIHPNARSEYDQGRVDSSMTLPAVTILLKPSAAQQAELDRLLADQQNPSSPNYHHWLTPEEYADRFGASAEDIEQITGWLRQHNLNVTSVGRGRNSITFSGTAGQVESAFGAEIHHYEVNGRRHFANAQEPTIPSALSGVVLGIRG